MNAIGTQLCDSINSRLTRWRMAVINEQMDAAAERGRNHLRKKSTKFSLSMEISRLTRDKTAEPVSRDQIISQARTGTGKYSFSLINSTDHVQDWQPYRVDPYYFYNIPGTCIGQLQDKNCPPVHN